MIPSQFFQLEKNERAFIVAAIQIKMEEDIKREKQVKKSRK